MNLVAPASRLAIGTAQFGMIYGVANRSGKVSLVNGRKILMRAREAGIDTIDTAISYGDSERQLGMIGVSNWRVISKLPNSICDESLVVEWARNHVESSLRRLQIPTLYGILLHRSTDLLSTRGEALFNALSLMKKLGLVQRIGVSVYSPSEVNAIISRYPIDIVQVPFNIFDRRLVETGCLQALKEAGIEVHVRSIFLQGLLVMPRLSRKAYFFRWDKLFSHWEEWLADENLTAVQACLAYVLSEPAIDHVVVGIDSVTQLEDIIQNTVNKVPLPPDNLCSDDLDLINPSNWNHL